MRGATQTGPLLAILAFGFVPPQVKAVPQIQHVRIYPTFQITERDEITFEVFITTGQTLFLTEPVRITVEDNQIAIDIFVETGAIWAPFFLTTARTTRLPAGEYGYTITVHPDVGEADAVGGQLTVAPGYPVPPWADPRELYWYDYFSIKRVAANGMRIEALPSQLAPQDYATGLDPPRIYWIDNGGFLIQRANLDGSYPEPIARLEPGTAAGELALDEQAGKLYWSVESFRPDTVDSIQRANLDGTDVEEFIGDMPARALALADGNLYWVGLDQNAGTLSRILWRASLSGGARDPIATGLIGDHDLDVDSVDGKLYWVEGGDACAIRRSNLDGSKNEPVVPDACPNYFEVDPVTEAIFWNEPHAIWRATPGEDRPVAVLERPGARIASSTLDAAARRLYWDESSSEKDGERTLFRANLDGTNIERVADELWAAVEVRPLTLSLRHFAMFQNCFLPGPVPRSPDCLTMDFWMNNGEIDLLDFSVLVGLLGGPQVAQ